jgi:hypothetical protein
VTFADYREALLGKIARLTWLLNLFPLDGFDDAELDALVNEVASFSCACTKYKEQRGIT